MLCLMWVSLSSGDNYVRIKVKMYITLQTADYFANGKSSTFPKTALLGLLATFQYFNNFFDSMTTCTTREFDEAEEFSQDIDK